MIYILYILSLFYIIRAGIIFQDLVLGQHQIEAPGRGEGVDPDRRNFEELGRLRNVGKHPQSEKKDKIFGT